MSRWEARDKLRLPPGMGVPGHAYQKGMWAANLPFKILGFFEFWIKKNKNFFGKGFIRYDSLLL
jgi:hypothetical protein